MRSLIDKRKMIVYPHSDLSISRQCELLGLARSSLYYVPKAESVLNLKLMRLMDEHYLDHPYKGARRMHVWLTKDKGYQVSKNRIERLYYSVMGLRSVLPGPHTSKPGKGHKIYPYLLRELKISHPNQVWATDITYIPMLRGYLYLIAIIDLFSRFVVGWSLSNTMEADWCRQCLEDAVFVHGRPEILNTDQGSQFTSNTYSDYVVNELKIKLSLDGKGRATDNAFIERLWRSIKYEKIYLNPVSDGVLLYKMIQEYLLYYNFSRRHQGIEDKFPYELYNPALLKKAI